MRRIFANDELEAKITRNGYAILKNLLPEMDCDKLEAFFTAFDTVDSRAFTISNWNNNADYRRKIYNQLSNALYPSVNKILLNYKPVMAVFASKRPGIKSEMLLHQDWSLVDETEYRSVSVWIALCDTNGTNGNLQVAEGSHLYAGYPRGMNLPVPFENIRAELEQQFLTDIPLSKGDAIVFDHRLIHCSPENKSAGMRLAAVLALIPSEAELIHYYSALGDGKAIEVLKMRTDEFHLLDFFQIDSKPQNECVLRKMSWSTGPLGLKEVREVLNELN